MSFFTFVLFVVWFGLFMVDGYRFSRRKKNKGRLEGWRETENCRKENSAKGRDERRDIYWIRN